MTKRNRVVAVTVSVEPEEGDWRDFIGTGDDPEQFREDLNSGALEYVNLLVELKIELRSGRITSTAESLGGIGLRMGDDMEKRASVAYLREAYNNLLSGVAAEAKAQFHVTDRSIREADDELRASINSPWWL